MVHQRALRRAFSDYAAALIGRYEVGEVLYRLTDQVVDVLDVDGAGVCLGQEVEGLRFVTATGERVSRLEHVQLETGEGPCFDAYRDGAIVLCEDLERDERWPSYREVAAEARYGAVAGIPMPVGEGRIGVLDLYRREPCTWDDETIEVGQLLADMASGYVLNWRTLEESRTLAGQLQHALDSRIVIEQAKGVVAARNDIGVAEAFERLRRQARSTSTQLHEVCQQVVEGDLEI